MKTYTPRKVTVILDAYVHNDGLPPAPDGANDRGEITVFFAFEPRSEDSRLTVSTDRPPDEFEVDGGEPMIRRLPDGSRLLKLNFTDCWPADVDEAIREAVNQLADARIE